MREVFYATCACGEQIESNGADVWWTVGTCKCNCRSGVEHKPALPDLRDRSAIEEWLDAPA